MGPIVIACVAPILRRSERDPASIRICITPPPGVRKAEHHHTTTPYQSVRWSCKSAAIKGMMHPAVGTSGLFPVGGD